MTRFGIAAIGVLAILSPITAIAQVASISPADYTGASRPQAREDDITAQNAPTVFIAAPIGSITIGTDESNARPRAYAMRSSGQTGMVVRFSSAPQRAGPNITFGVGRPLAYAAMTSAFGERRAMQGGGTRPHAGVDLAAPLGSPVAATMPGRVLSAAWAGSYGLLVVVDHGGGVQTRYAHLSRIAVVPGQNVSQGQVLGLVGSTGHSTGAHLHYELRQGGRALNPLAN